MGAIDTGTAVYVSALEQSLQDKWNVMEEMLKLTKQQEQLLQTESMKYEEFDELIRKKEILLQKIQKLDDGFEKAYRTAGEQIRLQKEYFKPQILQMQNLIRLITDIGVKIQAIEYRNKEMFTRFTEKKRKEIRDFQTNNKTANAYYQNMANQHRQWQSYFLDKKQ